jgi:hypothetical protein
MPFLSSYMYAEAAKIWIKHYTKNAQGHRGGTKTVYLKLLQQKKMTDK